MNAKSQSKSRAAEGPQSPLQAFLLSMSGFMMVDIARQLRNATLSVAEFAAIFLLLRGKPLRINELGEALDQPLPSASRIASTLVDRGLVDRREDAADRRAKILTLTPKGRAMIYG